MTEQRGGYQVEDTPDIPHSVEAEQAVIGSILIDPACLHDMEFLTPKYFYIHRNRWIYEACLRLHEKRQGIDILTVAEELDRLEQLEEAGGPAYLTALVGQVPTTLNVLSYAHIVEADGIRRALLEAANRIASLAYDDSKEISECAEQATQAVQEAANGSIHSRMIEMDKLVSEYYDLVDQRAKIGTTPGVPTGFIDLDMLLGGGLQAGDLVLLAGRPGLGKTKLLTQAAGYACEKGGKRGALFTLEMSKEEIMGRIISQVSGIDSQVLRNGKLSDDEWPLFTDAIERVGAWKLAIDDTPGLSPAQLRGKCVNLAMRGLDFVVVDYVQLMRGVGTSREQEVSYISRNLKLLARELDAPVLAAAQLNRALEARGDRRPTIADLRESGSQEQDADAVALLWKNPADDEVGNVTTILLDKQRNGPTGVVKLVSRDACLRFENMQRRYT